MGEYLMFQMWGPFRESLVKGHLFYFEQARKRLLSQFENIEADADKATKEWLEHNSQNFDPDVHDSGDFYEEAQEAGIEFYRLLAEMREQTRLSVVAGMFHEWEKQLRAWLMHEIHYWHRGRNVEARVWSADFVQVTDLLECLGWDIRSMAYYRELDACRLVVNVYKHGSGKSLDDLKNSFPEYLDDPLKLVGKPTLTAGHLDHTHLKVSDEQLRAFSNAIVKFWRDVPDNVFESQITDIPVWLERAVLKDRA